MLVTAQFSWPRFVLICFLFIAAAIGQPKMLFAQWIAADGYDAQNGYPFLQNLEIDRRQPPDVNIWSFGAQTDLCVYVIPTMVNAAGRLEPQVGDQVRNADCKTDPTGGRATAWGGLKDWRMVHYIENMYQIVWWGGLKIWGNNTNPNDFNKLCIGRPLGGREPEMVACRAQGDDDFVNQVFRFIEVPGNRIPGPRSYQSVNLASEFHTYRIFAGGETPTCLGFDGAPKVPGSTLTFLNCTDYPWIETFFTLQFGGQKKPNVSPLPLQVKESWEISTDGNDQGYLRGNIWRTNSGYSLVFGRDGSFRVFDANERVIKEIAPPNRAANSLYFQADGNIVIKTQTGSVLWNICLNSRNQGGKSARFILQGNGVFAVWDDKDTGQFHVWDSGLPTQPMGLPACAG